LYQNLLFYAENEEANRPSGVIFLEGCYCERLITPIGTGPKGKDSDKQLTVSSTYCFPLFFLPMETFLNSVEPRLGSLHRHFCPHLISELMPRYLQ
jgi:hypothetical protein